MDILLVNSVEFTVVNAKPQLGQLILRKILRKKYDVDYVNFDYLIKTGELLFEDNYKKSIRSFTDYIICRDPKIVGFYTICDSFITTIEIAKLLKHDRPDIKIVFGGPHATMTYKECLESFPFVDVISTGEGERTIEPLMDALMNDGNLDGLFGVAYRKDGEIVRSDDAKMVPACELCHYTEFDYSPYVITDKTTVSIEAGRGCPFSCGFCSTNMFWKNNYRIKTARQMVDEMKEFNRLYGVTMFDLTHDMLTADKKMILEFCKILIEENLNLEWGCSARIDCLDDEMLTMMKKAKCFEIYIGIETGSPRMQKIENKNLNLDNAVARLIQMRKMGFDIEVSFIYGYPEETIEDVRKTFGMIDTLIDNGIYTIQLHRYRVLPGTPDYFKVKDKLYFSEDVVEETELIYQYIFEDPEVVKTIKDNKDAFVQNYTFDNEVRTKFRNAEAVFIMLSALLRNNFEKSAVELKRKYTLEELILMSDDFVEENICGKNKLKGYQGKYTDFRAMSMYYFNTTAKWMEEMSKIISPKLSDIFFYENLCRDAKFGRLEGKHTYQFAYNVYDGVKTGEFVKEDTVVQFEVKDSVVSIKKCKLISEAAQ